MATIAALLAGGHSEAEVLELYDLEEALDVYCDERLDSYRKWLKIGSRSEAALALRDFRRIRRLFRTIGMRASGEAE